MTAYKRVFSNDQMAEILADENKMVIAPQVIIDKSTARDYDFFL